MTDETSNWAVCVITTPFQFSTNFFYQIGVCRWKNYLSPELVIWQYFEQVWTSLQKIMGVHVQRNPVTLNLDIYYEEEDGSEE